MVKMGKGQVSFEFFFVISVVIVITLVIGALAASRLTDLKDRQMDTRFSDIAYAIRNEIDIAHSMAPGYARDFYLPNTIDGGNYSVVINGNLLTVSSGDREFVLQIQPVSGDVINGWNTISKEDGQVVLNA
jgi:hypothetical protein